MAISAMVRHFQDDFNGKMAVILIFNVSAIYAKMRYQQWISWYGIHGVSNHFEIQNVCHTECKAKCFKNFIPFSLPFWMYKCTQFNNMLLKCKFLKINKK